MIKRYTHLLITTSIKRVNEVCYVEMFYAGAGSCCEAVSYGRPM